MDHSDRIGAGEQLPAATTANQGSRPQDISDEPFLVANNGTAYYVNDGTVQAGDWTTAAGNNANSGKTPDQPMASLRALLTAYDLDPSDVIYVDAGTYNLASNTVITAEDSGVTIEGYHELLHPDRQAVLNRDNSFAGSYGSS